MKAKFRFFSLFALALFVFFSITSCDNFTNASDVRLQIEQNIAYNMASPYTIELTPSIPSSGSFKAPVATDSVDKKVSDSFTLTYEPSPEFDFLEWKVKDSNTGNDVDGYFQLESKSSASTKCTFIKAPESGMQLCLYAVIVERPKKLDYSPQWSSNGVPKDSRIQVRFTKPMDESSIYYSDPERDAIKEETGFQHFLPETGNGPKYGYVKSDKHYWKNISIVDNSDGVTSMLEYFEKPAFEDSRTFVITTKKSKPLTEGTELFVTLNKNFLCKESGETTEKYVTLNDSIVWVYLVNGSTDGQDPSFTSSSITSSSGGSLATYTSSTSTPTMLSKGIVNFDIKVSDGGSGPASVFNIELEDSSGQKKNVPIRFKSVVGTTAKYIGAYSFSVDDGNYKINSITASDRSNRTTVNTFSSPYYIGIDNNPPQVTYYKAVPYGYENSKKGQVRYSYTIDEKEKNFQGINIKYKESGNSQTWDEISPEWYTLTANSGGVDMDDLDPGKTYDIYAEFWDRANNSTVKIIENVETLPNKPSSVDVERITETGKKDKFKITWVPPEGNYSGVMIRTETNTTTSEKIVLDSNNSHEVITDEYDYGKKFTFKVYSIKRSGLEDTDRSAAYVSKQMWTRPAKLAQNDVSFSLISSKLTMKSSKILTVRVRYKKSTETEYGSPKTISTTSETNIIYEIGSLEPATKYDIKVTQYDSTSGLESDAIYFMNQYSSPGGPKNVQITTQSNTQKASILLTWDTPAGDFDKYILEFYKYSGGGTTSTIIPKTANTYEITNLDLLDEYIIKMHTEYTVPGTNTKLSSSVYSNPVYTPPQAAEISCSFNDSYNVEVNWDLPHESPYTNKSTITLCYGADEATVKAGTNSVPLSWKQTMLIYSPVAATLLRSTIGLYNQNCYFAIKTTCKNSSNQNVTSWSEVKSLLMPPNIKPYEISVNNVSSDAVIVNLKKPSNPTSWGRINLYKQTGSGEETFVGSIENTTNASGYNYVITDLFPNTPYTISAKTELNGYESYATTVNITTPGTITGNLNLFVSKPSNGNTLTIVWTSSVVRQTTINGESIARVGIRYREIDSDTWRYPEEWGGEVSLKSVMVMTSWEGGYSTDTGNSGQYTLPSGTYIIELVGYYKAGSKAQILSTNSVTYTVP